MLLILLIVLRGKIKMTPSEQAKAQGFKSLAQVAEISTVKRRTLENWHKDKPELFNIVLLGCYAIQNNKVN